MYKIILTVTLFAIITLSHSQHLDSILDDKTYLDKVEEHIVETVKDIGLRFSTESRKMEIATKQFVVVKLRQNIFEALKTITSKKILEDDRKVSRQDDGLGTDITNLIDGIENEDTANGLNTGLRISQGILKFIDKAAKQVFGGLLTVITGISGGAAGGAGAAGAAGGGGGGGAGNKNKGNTANTGTKVKVTKGHQENQLGEINEVDLLIDTLSSAKSKPFHEQFVEILAVTPGLNFLSNFQATTHNFQPLLVISSTFNQALLLKPNSTSAQSKDDGERQFIGYLTKNYLKIWETHHSKSVPDLYDGIAEPLNVLKSLKSVTVVF